MCKIWNINTKYLVDVDCVSKLHVPCALVILSLLLLLMMMMMMTMVCQFMPISFAFIDIT